MNKKMNTVELRDAISQLRQKGKAIVALAKSENRDYTEEEQKEVDALKEEIEAKKAELKELQQKLDEAAFEDDDTEEEVKEVAEDDVVEEDVEEIEETEEGAVEEDTDETKADDEELEPQDEENKGKRSYNRNMNKKFSLVQAIRSVGDKSVKLNEATKAVLTAGKKEAMEARSDVSGQIQLPMYRAALTVTDNGKDTVETDIEKILAPFREDNVLVKAGATVYNNLKNNVKIPVLKDGQVGWVGEINAASDAGYATDGVEIKPKRISAYVDLSNELLIQDSSAVEETIMKDLVDALTEKLVETALGSDAATAVKPAGMFSVLTPKTITKYEELVEAESDVDDAKVGDNRCYVMSNKAKAALRAMQKSSKSTQLVMENGEVDGTKAYSTACMGTDKKYIYGDFSNVAIGFWGGLDIQVDPYTQAINGCTRLILNAYVDFAVVRPEAFVAGTIA